MSVVSSTDASVQSELEREVARRRTFAIISHPDAGKTTLRKSSCSMPGQSSWPAPFAAAKVARRRRRLDGARAAAGQFDHLRSARVRAAGPPHVAARHPGHKDFSEDTYRALIAADSVVMVIDAANGVESQTRKLFEVCRQHRLPILTFINSSIGPRAIHSSWSMTGDDARHLRGAGELANRQRGAVPRGLRHQRAELHLYEREAQGQYRAPVDVSALDDAAPAR